MNTSAYADDLRTAINLDDYTNLVAALGTQLNSPKDRFDKSDIIEQCIDVYSNGRLSWVDEVGRDHRDTLLNVDIDQFKDNPWTNAQKYRSPRDPSRKRNRKG